MKPKYTLVTLAIMALLTLGMTVGCTKARSDAQVASDVQNKIFSDAAVQSRQVTVQSSNGVVTLSGYVTSDAERAAAANDAAQVEGVKTVVNNLQASAPAAQPPQEQPQAQAPPEEPAPARRAPARERSTPTRSRPSAYHSAPAAQPEPQYSAAAAPAPVNVAPVAPAAPLPPAKVTIPDGTTFSVRLIDNIDSDTAQPGQQFRASLDGPVVVDDNVIVPTGADISGRVVDVKSAGRFAGKSALAVELTKLSYNGKTYSLHTNQYSREGTSRGATTAKRVGAGAAIGAIIGGLAGGGKGAAIGATAGAGAGGGATAIHKGEQIRFNSEQVLVFTLQSPLTVSPAGNLDRNKGRQSLDE
ncbi:MAG TPA: BON domain-containing protein [Terriglobales bacterium]|jgi:hypothetical protein|nr:BON domain-containing protein [Terriglobales bacterium]